jgi:protein-tyrosine phosphatase
MFCCELISGLWIGDTDIMRSKKFLEENDIKIIVNFTIDIGFPENNDIKNVRIPISEQLKYSNDIMKLNTYLEDLLNLIKNNTDKNNILLSCYDGKSVSALVVALYIIKFSSITRDTVRQIIQSKCRDISLDYDFSVFDV